MKTFNDLTATTELENGAILPANNAANTVTNKITFANLKSQIRGSLVSGVSLSGTTLTVTHADDTSAADADTFTTQDTWTAMTGASNSANGTAGYVPAPPSNGYNTKYLRADGTWEVPQDTNTHYTSNTVVAASASGVTDAAAANSEVYLNHIENGDVTSSHNIVGSGATSVTSNNSGTITISSSDTHYASSTVVGASNSATANAAGTNGNVYINHIENGTVASAHGISGSGATSVTSDASGNITVSSTDTWTAMTGATSEANGTAGYVPAPPSTGYNSKFLRADGTWATVEQITVDSALSDSSENPLQNKAIYTALGLKANAADLGTAAAKNITNTYSSTGEDAVSGKAVAEALASLPEPMVFKGTLGTGGTIETLPAAASSGSNKNTGFTYKVITAGTYRGITVAVGDTVISTGSDWTIVPSGDEPSGTVTSVGITDGTGISVSGGPITSSGSITVSHGDTSDQSSVSNSGRTYVQSITLDDFGHVTAISSGTETVTDTDTHYASETVTAATAAGKADAVATNGNVYLNHIENDTVVSSHNIVGSGATTVTSDANGVITISSTDNNTTYTPASLGFGYATCSTANGTAAKTASLTDYELVTGGFVAVKFTYAVDASATLSINSQTAKAIFYQGAAIAAGDIPAGATALLVYDGTQYNLVGLIPALVNAFDGGDEG